jgi:hypothetical protein
MDAKASGKDIIIAVVDNMQESCEPLLYNILVPSYYDVYLHRDDYNRLTSIFPRIREEGVQALDAKLAELNKKGFSLAGLRSSKEKYEAAEKEWSIKFHIDENDELTPGDILVDSRLALPAPVEFGVGTKTQRSETIRSGGETKRLRKHQQDGQADGGTAIAKLSYQEKSGQPREFLVTAAEISVGRGGRNEFCDLELDGPADISRRHFYLRQDPETREFFIQDVSRFGTAIDGKKIAPKEWVRLPAKATIALADKMTVEFQQL